MRARGPRLGSGGPLVDLNTTSDNVITNRVSNGFSGLHCTFAQHTKNSITRLRPLQDPSSTLENPPSPGKKIKMTRSPKEARLLSTWSTPSMLNRIGKSSARLMIFVTLLPYPGSDSPSPSLSCESDFCGLWGRHYILLIR